VAACAEDAGLDDCDAKRLELVDERLGDGLDTELGGRVEIEARAGREAAMELIMMTWPDRWRCITGRTARGHVSTPKKLVSNSLRASPMVVSSTAPKSPRPALFP
jgi:hypothetical protein